MTTTNLFFADLQNIRGRYPLLWPGLAAWIDAQIRHNLDYRWGWRDCYDVLTSTNYHLGLSLTPQGWRYVVHQGRKEVVSRVLVGCYDRHTAEGQAFMAAFDHLEAASKAVKSFAE